MLKKQEFLLLKSHFPCSEKKIFTVEGKKITGSIDRGLCFIVRLIHRFFKNLAKQTIIRATYLAQGLVNHDRSN
jgi:hypothetical protein